MKLQEYLKRMAAQTAASGKKTGPSDPAWAKRYPLLYALMTDDDAGGGKTRARSKVTLWMEPQAFKASVSEPDGSVSAYCSHPTLEGLLDALEARLTSDEPDVWVPWSGNYRKGKKR